MSYGSDFVEPFRQTASHADRILRGSSRAELPVQAPTRYRTVLNLKTAKALDLTVPASLSVTADAVIEQGRFYSAPRIMPCDGNPGYGDVSR